MAVYAALRSDRNAERAGIILRKVCEKPYRNGQEKAEGEKYQLPLSAVQMEMDTVFQRHPLLGIGV